MFFKLDEQLRNGFWLLYAFGFYVATSAATFITHNFMVKGVMVGISNIRNKKIKSVIEPVLVSVVKCWPKFLIGIYGHFILFSDIGEFSVMGSVAFNLHIGVAVYLFAMKGPQASSSYCDIFGNLIIVLASIAFAYFIRITTQSTWVEIALIIGCLVFYGIVVLLPIIRSKDEQQYEEHDLDNHDEKQTKISNNFCFQELPVR